MAKIREIIKNNRYMLGVAWRHSKVYFLVLVLMLLITYTKDLVLVIAPKYIFDGMQFGESVKDILIPVIVYVALYLILHLCVHALTYFKNILETKLKMELNVKLGEKFMKVDYSFLEDNKSIDMFNRAKIAIMGGLNEEQRSFGVIGEEGITGYFDQLLKVIKDIVLLVSVLFVFSYMEWYMFLAVVLCVVLNLIFSVVNMKAMVKIRVEAGACHVKSRYCNKLLRTFEYGKEFRVFGMTDFVISKFHDTTKDYLDVRGNSRRESCLSAVMMNVANNMMRFIVLVSLVLLLKDGAVSVGDFSMIFAAILTFSDTAKDMLNAILSLNIFSSFMMDYEKCMKLSEDKNDEDGRELSSGTHIIEVKNLWFKYANTTEYALKDINVTINPCENISIVGFNGAGKTTFIKLLLGLYKPTEGSILIDGRDISEYSSRSLRRYMSAVFQDYKIFALTIEDNIALEQDVNEQELVKSIKRAGIDEKISSLDKKEKSVIGGFFDKGDMMLSGGESQKIAMARSFYRKSSLIALDEPTSALDVISEDKMYKAVAGESDDETILFISHRLASTRFCNRILVFDSGRIVEEGTPKELLSKKGVYYEMWNVQAKKFDGRSGDER
ncbi:MAG: ABC transporter ATP-binding protein [Lachnospiraceae bacterium]|nr:ABC transporter ATP-binding protein [Lachnospiraceae bacterium]